MNVAIIMAGGSGTRFWPWSRSAKAKQSLPLFSEKTLLQETIERVYPVFSSIVVIAAEKQREHIERDIRPYSKVTALYEPIGRNTAPCITLGVRYVEEAFSPDARVVVLPADHFVRDEEEFRRRIHAALSFLNVQPNGIGTVGIKPTRPETGYGYIKLKEEYEDRIFAVERFEEKPPLERAKRFFESGNYLWNGGIFVFNLPTMKEEIKRLKPGIFEGVYAIPSLSSIKKEEYALLESVSIDYAVMEKTERPIFSVEGDFGWSDVGNWYSYYELLPKDERGNAVVGKVRLFDTEESLIVNLTEREVVVNSQKGMLFVFTEDVAYSSPLELYSSVKGVVEAFQREGREDIL